jgi:oligoribonuclease
MTQSAENLIWIDLEMTGLEPEHDLIIEIATVITDGELNTLAEGPVLAVKQPDEALAAMDEWNTKQHNKSGLVSRVRASDVSAEQAERMTIAFLREYVPENVSPMCGNSICQDRRFLYRYMPDLALYFHYRNLDVSTIKELVKRWSPETRPPRKEAVHLALDDIRESIEELKFYRQHVFRI